LKLDSKGTPVRGQYGKYGQFLRNISSAVVENPWKSARRSAFPHVEEFSLDRPRNARFSGPPSVRRCVMADGSANMTAGAAMAPGATTVAAERLRSFLERVERLEEEKSTIAGDIKEVFAEAKGEGYDTKTLRKIIRLRKMDRAKRDEEEALLDLYLSALGE